MSKSAYDILINVVGAVVYAALVWIVRAVWSRVSGASPLLKIGRVLVTIVLGFVIALIATFGAGANPTATWTVFAGLISMFLLRELSQFWKVGLVAVDREMQTGISPKSSLKLCRSSLRFLGIGAAKLTEHAREFESAIDRCDNPHQPTLFLLSRPDAEGLERIARMAKRDRSDYQRAVQESLRTIARLKVERNKNIEVRFYKDFPAFRLLFMNDNLCLVSHYVLGKGPGFDLPQMHVVRTATASDKTSLYYAFEYYFNTIWTNAEPWDFRSYL